MGPASNHEENDGVMPRDTFAQALEMGADIDEEGGVMATTTPSASAAAQQQPKELVAAARPQRSFCDACCYYCCCCCCCKSTEPPSAGKPELLACMTPRQQRTYRDLQRIQYWMDDAFVICGRKVGLDPLVGLLPVVGDGASAAVSLAFVARAAPDLDNRYTLTRMLVNVYIDTVLGAIPLLGDIFDIGWRANERNLAIYEDVVLRQHRRSLHKLRQQQMRNSHDNVAAARSIVTYPNAGTTTVTEAAAQPVSMSEPLPADATTTRRFKDRNCLITILVLMFFFCLACALAVFALVVCIIIYIVRNA